MADKPILVEKFNEKLDLDGKMREGGILAKVYLEVQGNDLEAAKKALENTIFNKLGAEENVNLLEVKMYDILKEEGDHFSGVSEIHLVADDFRHFITTILRYGPSAVEITEPEEVTLNTEQMHNIVADVSDFTHMFSQQIISMLKDPERRALLEKVMSEK
ncbi:MAG: hypothetical protein GF416_07535 [Candidatus Altiarchaeales archaeon]|nr:hypothetical protein [Candidatus Altiarchaeales archaeon]MBD3416964.1 hypothetical protein [Candidatus Altiarchaeales archaeon]